MRELAEQLLSDLKATWRYRWFAVIVAWIIALCGWIVVHRMPDRFEASARVYVDTQSVLRPLLTGLATQPNVDQLVVMMSRTLISRPNMERVIGMADMELELKTSEDREQLVTRLTREVTMQSAGDPNLYTIVYTEKNPQQAKRVVQSLLAIFMEGSLSDKRTDSEAAQRFIDEQLQSSKEKLDAAEYAVTEFKRRQVLMGGSRDYSRVIEAQAALREATLELKIAETSRDAIKNKVRDATEVPTLLGDTGADVEDHPETDARIQALEQKLDGLRLNYTEEHPDIVAIQRTIAQLKEQKKAEPKRTRPSARQVQVSDPVTLSLATAEANVAAVKARVEEYSKRYDELRAAAIAAPDIDAKLGQLTRDYDMAKSSYAALLSRRETARISREMETTTSVAHFRVIDPPRVSSVPKSPNRRLLNSLVLVAALGGGAGLAFVLSQIRPTINDERRLREVSSLPVLGTVLMAWTDSQKARRTRGLVGLLICLASLLSAYAAIMAALMLTVSRV